MSRIDVQRRTEMSKEHSDNSVVSTQCSRCQRTENAAEWR